MSGAAGGQDEQIRAGLEQLRHLGRGLRHVLEVIEREQQLLVSQVTHKDVARSRALLLAQREGPNDAGQDQSRVAQGGEGDERHAVLEEACRGARRVDGQARLADPADTRKRQ